MRFNSVSFKQRREALFLTQDDLVLKTGLSARTISRAENGESVGIESAENSRFNTFKQREINRRLTPYRVFGCGDEISGEPNAKNGDLAMSIPFDRQGRQRKPHERDEKANSHHENGPRHWNCRCRHRQ